jgi:hypothetical protein
MRYCSYVTDLLLLGKTANYCSCTDQVLLIHWQSNYWSVTEQLLVDYRPTIAHAPPTIAHAPTNYCSCTDRAEQLLVGYLPTIDHIMGNNTASRNTYYWSYIWPSKGRIIFWVYAVKFCMSIRHAAAVVIVYDRVRNQPNQPTTMYTIKLFWLK